MIWMLSIGSFVYGLFSPLGIGGLLLTLFLIFYFDATFIPTLPELFTVVIFMAQPTPSFAVLMVITLSVAEFCGVTTLYILFTRFRLPAWMKKRIVGYSKFLIVPDEKAILLNRVAPVIPFLGAFIATCDWPFGRSILYNFAGGAAKYSLLIAMASTLLYYLSNGTLAELFTIAAVAVLIGVSFMLSSVRRRRMRKGAEGGPA